MRSLETSIGDYESGRLLLVTDGRGTVVQVHWPADRETDEWIDFGVPLSNEDISRFLAVGFSDRHSFGTGRVLAASSMADGGALLHLKGANAISAVTADIALDRSQYLEFLGHLREVSGP